MKRLSFLLLVGLTTSATLNANPRVRGGEVEREGPRGGSVSAEGEQVGRYHSGSVDIDGPNGGSVDADGQGFGRFGSRSVDAEGPDGGTVDRDVNRAGPYRNTNVDVDTRNVDVDRNVTTVNRDVTTWNGYRAGYVYRDGAYVQANVVVNQTYVAPIGSYAGWSIVALPAFVAYPAFATYPVEVAVQVQLQQLGYYGGPIDGDLGPSTAAAISKYQAAEGIAVTGTITPALLSELGIAQ